MSAERRYHLEADSWLSAVLERQAWNVVAGGGAPLLSDLSRAAGHFATAKIAATDPGEVEALQRMGFRVVDTALTLDVERVIARASSVRVRFATQADKAGVQAIAGSAFRYSRFHLDPRVPKALADKVKWSWAGNWFDGGRGDGMVVAEDANRALAGFLLLRWGSREHLAIDLVAVDQRSERKGLASAMIGFAQANGTGDLRKPRGMVVGTQAANIGSLRLYESLGFRMREAKYVLHHHGYER